MNKRSFAQGQDSNLKYTKVLPIGRTLAMNYKCVAKQ